MNTTTRTIHEKQGRFKNGKYFFGCIGVRDLLESKSRKNVICFNKDKTRQAEVDIPMLRKLVKAKQVKIRYSHRNHIPIVCVQDMPDSTVTISRVTKKNQ